MSVKSYKICCDLLSQDKSLVFVGGFLLQNFTAGPGEPPFHCETSSIRWCAPGFAGPFCFFVTHHC